MYEYDVYADARQTLPRVREPLQAMDGEYYLVKTDILARTMSFSSSKDAMVNVVTIPTTRVREIIAMNRAGRKVESLVDKDSVKVVEEPTFRTEEDSITRFDNQNKRHRRNRKEQRNGGRQRQNDGAERQPKAVSAEQGENSREASEQRGEQRGERGQRRDRRDNRHRGRGHRHGHHSGGEQPKHEPKQSE
jgi:hypothetical protein